MAERLLAYSNEVSLAPGDSVEIKVSAPLPGAYRAQLVRLICGDDGKDGPGFKVEPIAAPATANIRRDNSRSTPGHMSSFRTADRSSAAVSPCWRWSGPR